MIEQQFSDLPVSETIPTFQEEMFLNDPRAANGGSIARRAGDAVYFDSRRGQPMRYVVRLEVVLGDTIKEFPNASSAVPNIFGYRALFLSLRDRNGSYLVRDLPFVSILMNNATRPQLKSKWWNYLPVDWEQSYVTSSIQQNCWALLRVVYGR